MNENPLDDQGTTQEQALGMLHALRDEGFEGDSAKLAIALGRDEEETNNLLDGTEDIDDDLMMKIRGIAQAREVEIE